MLEGVEDSFGVVSHLFVTAANDRDAESLKNPVTSLVAILTMQVHITVDLDRETELRAVEIDDEAPDDMLPTKAPAP